MVVTPRDAATVVLLRDSPVQEEGIEVLMVRRHAKSRFVPDAYVYPGGRIEEADYAPGVEDHCLGLDSGEAHRFISDIDPPEKALGAWVAGIRETFEEVGVLLAIDSPGELLRIGPEREARMESHRRNLHADRASLGEILQAEGLKLAAGELRYFAHWITPVTSPIRYDVRFFVGRAPVGQNPSHDGVELTEHRWISPRTALAEYDQGRFPVILPTWSTLNDLSRFRTVDEVLDCARETTVPAILTRVVLRGGRPVEVMPDDIREGDEPL
jgi:8-oxo-dGTP pyrophosphatase MutT (NUDIX family)